jgi:hypothetical protein
MLSTHLLADWANAVVPVFTAHLLTARADAIIEVVAAKLVFVAHATQCFTLDSGRRFSPRHWKKTTA